MKDQEGAAATVCDWSETARSPQAAYQLIDRALAENAAGVGLPKHMQVPISLLEGAAPPPPTAPALPQTSDTPAAALAQVVTMLAEAQRPLFIFGGGAVKGCETWVDGFAGLGAASFTTYAGRGTIPDDAPLHFGSTLARPSSAEVIASADLVIAVGTRLSEVDLWRDALGHQAPLVRIDLDPESLSDRHNADLRILGDAAAQMRGIVAAAKGANGWSADEVRQQRAKWRSELLAERPGILPVAEYLHSVLPENTMIYSDMTQFAYAAKEVYPMSRPGHWHHPYGFGTLGYALPAAIGGQVGRKTAAGYLPTLAIHGDYGFQYTLQELGVAVELGLPLPIIIWDNGKLGEIEASMVAAQIAPNAVIQRNPDFLKLAEAYGAHATQPKTLDELGEALAAAFAADRPTIIRVMSDIALPA